MRRETEKSATWGANLPDRLADPSNHNASLSCSRSKDEKCMPYPPCRYIAAERCESFSLMGPSGFIRGQICLGSSAVGTHLHPLLLSLTDPLLRQTRYDKPYLEGVSLRPDFIHCGLWRWYCCSIAEGLVSGQCLDRPAGSEGAAGNPAILAI